MLVYARAIASMRYPESVLVNGLQPLDDFEMNGETRPGLRNKYLHELTEEFMQAKYRWLAEQTEEHRLDMLAEAADLVYYACQIDEQQHTSNTLEDTFVTLRGPSSQISKEEAKAAALAKYASRSAQLESKDHDGERIAIMAVINAIPERNPNWGGRRANQAGRPRRESGEKG